LIDIGADIIQEAQSSTGGHTPDTTQDEIRTEHNIEVTKRKNEILGTIQGLNRKIKKHELKEGMLDMIIASTYAELEDIKPNEFTRRGQKQSVLIKQLEALSILHDTLMKYEDMIQKYHKILIDIENNKLNSYIKLESLKHEEKLTEENLSTLMGAVQEQLKNGMLGSTNSNPLLEEIQLELENDNY